MMNSQDHRDATAPEPKIVPGLASPDELATDRHFAMNLARGLQVLRAFSPADPMLGNRDLCERTGLPKATVSRLTYTLTLLGYLTPVPRLQKFRLGPGVLSLGYPLFASMQARQIVRPHMERLARETGCSVNLGMRDRLGVVYVDTCRVDAANVHRPDIGSTRPLLATAIGRALVLAAPPAERAAILNRLRLDDPERHARERPLLDADERRLAEHGFCRSRGDWRREVHAVAVPLKLAEGGDALALNCTSSAHELGEDRLERDVAPRLMEAALCIAQASGLH